MKRATAILIVVCAALTFNAAGTQVGIEPVPVVKGVSVQTSIKLDKSRNTYTYSYAVTNPTDNTGSIWKIEIDLSAPSQLAGKLRAAGFTIPRGASGDVPFVKVYDTMRSMVDVPPALSVVPFGITTPKGWAGSLSVTGTGGFWATNNGRTIGPGQTLGNLNLLSHGMPTIRKMQLIPDWNLVVGDHEATEDEEILAEKIQQSLVIDVYVLGPSPISYGVHDFRHVFDQLKQDLPVAIRIGWIPDAELAHSLAASLASVTKSFDETGRSNKVYSLLGDMLKTVQSAKPGRLTSNGRQLLYFDLKKMLRDFGTPLKAA